MIFIYLLIMIAVFAVIMVGMMKFTIFITGRAVGKSIDKVHKEAEFIINYGTIPAVWINNKIDLLNYSNYKKFIKKKFKVMEHHFQNAPVFEDEETRQLLLSRLKEKYEMFQSEDFLDKIRKEYT